MRIAFMMTAAALLLGLGGEARADAVGNQLSLQRNALQGDYRKVAREVDAVEAELEAQEGEETTVTGTATGIWAFRNAMRDRLDKLESRRDQLRDRLDDIKRDFRNLTTRAEEHYGELPMWWGDLD